VLAFCLYGGAIIKACNGLAHRVTVAAIRAIG